MAFRGVILYRVHLFLSPRTDLNFRHLSSCDTMTTAISEQKKLRTYSSFKTILKLEPYLCVVKNVKIRRCIKARSHDSLVRIRFLLVPKIGSCEHIENDLLTHGSVILKKRMEIEHALFSSDTLLERWKAPTNFAWYNCDCFGAKLKILC